MKNTVKSILILLSPFVLALFALLIFTKTRPLDELIVHTCTAKENSLTQRYYKWSIYTLHNSEEEVEAMVERAGLNFVIAYQEPINYELFEWLLDQGADINAVSPVDSMTPLHVSLLYDNVELVHFLLDRGANPQSTELRKNLTACQFLKLLKNNKDELTYRAMKNALKCDLDTL